MARTLVEAVLAVAPDARIRSDGFMRWIEAGGEILGDRKATGDKAWRSALGFIREGYKPLRPSREQLAEIARQHIYLTAHSGPSDLCERIADDVLAAMKAANASPAGTEKKP